MKLESDEYFRSKHQQHYARITQLIFSRREKFLNLVKLDISAKFPDIAYDVIF